CPSGFGAAINFIFETTRTGLIFVIETEHHVDHRHCFLHCEALKRIRYRAAQILCVIGFALQNHPASDDCVSAFPRGQFAHDQGKALDRKSTRLNSSHRTISYAVFCLKKKKKKKSNNIQYLNKTKQK